MMQTRLDMDENQFRPEGAMFLTVQNKSELVQVAIFVRDIQTGTLSRNVNIKRGRAKQNYSLLAPSSKIPQMWIYPQVCMYSHVLSCDYSFSSSSAPSTHLLKGLQAQKKITSSAFSFENDMFAQPLGNIIHWIIYLISSSFCSSLRDKSKKEKVNRVRFYPSSREHM